MKNNLSITAAHIRQAAISYFAQVEDYQALTIRNFAAFVGVSQATIRRKFSYHEWISLRDEWFQKRLLQAMDALYPLAKTQLDFTAELIAKYAGVSTHFLDRYLHKEWLERKTTLPTLKEKVLTALQMLVDANIPVAELTRSRVLEVAGVDGFTQSWFAQPYRAAHRELIRRSHLRAVEPPSDVLNVRIIPGGWIDLDSTVWDLQPARRSVLRRDRLRHDFADIAWSLLREELYSGELALSTVVNHYVNFVELSTLFGNQLPDVKVASLEEIQRAWLHYNGTAGQRMFIRSTIVQLFETLMHLSKQDPTINGTEMMRIHGWLRDILTVSSLQSPEEFLSEDELNRTIECCLGDITAGISFMRTSPDLLKLSLRSTATENAAVVARWAIALMILVMICTRLRRESVLALKIDDWAEIRSGLFALIWRHGKKREEHAAAIPASLAQQLQAYVTSTAQVRTELCTEQVFLGSNRGHWGTIPPGQFHLNLHKFVARHRIERDGTPLQFSSTLLRRTYVTRALYEGRSLGALSLELGHMYVTTTLRYAKFDRYEHPAEVGSALEEYGRKALTLWKTPLVLDDLDTAERASLLKEKVARHQDVGLCRHCRCVMTELTSPPPCSLCEHLVTGPEFFDAWRAEHIYRKQALQTTTDESGTGLMFAQMKFQLERFEANFAFVQERSHI